MSDHIGLQLLRSIFSDKANLGIVLDHGITSTYMLDKEQQQLFAVISSADAHDREIDVAKLLLAFPGLTGLVNNLVGTITVQDVRHVISAIKFRHWKNNVLKKGGEWVKSATTSESREEISGSFAELGSLVDSQEAEVKNGLDVYESAVKEIEETYLARKSGKAIGSPTGLPTLDKCLSGGFKPGELVVIGAMTGKGKTHIGVSLAMNVIRSGLKVCHVTVEMSETAIMKRMIANQTGVNSKILTSGAFEPYNMESQMDAISRGAILGLENLIIVDDTNGSYEQLESLIRKIGRQGYDMLVIDYIQQFYFDKPLQNRVGELNQITSKIKHLTKKYKLATVMLAQLNREAQKEKERGKAHSSHQFEQSHSMAKDSDIILILDEDNIGGQEFLYLAKNRNGEDNLRIPVTLDRRISRLMEAK